MSNFTTYLARGTTLAVGTALAGVGVVASYKAAAAVHNDYLMVAAPLVSVAAPLTAILIEIALESKQRFKALVLLVAFGLCASVVFFTAAERNHDGRAVGEAQRLASRTTADRAERDLADAKADARMKTLAADKVRGKDTPKAKAALASETAAIARVATAEQAVRDATSAAVTDSGIQQADWLMPLAVDFGSVVFLWLGFSLGTVERKQPVVVVAKPARKAVDPVKSERSRRAAATRRARKEEAAKQAAIQSGKVVAIG